MNDISKIQVGETLYDVKDQTARDNFTNAKITTINNLSDDNHIPTAKSVYDYFNNQKTTSVDNGTNYNKLPTSGSVYNFINNKITSSISSSSTDSQIPTARAVYDYIQNNGSGNSSSSADTSSFFNLDDYYAIYTVHYNPDNLIEENRYDGIYKISDYTGHEGIFQTTVWDTMTSTYNTLSNFGPLLGVEEAYGLLNIGSSDAEVIFVFKQDTPMPIDNEIVTLPAGFYVAESEKDFTITQLVPKNNYIKQKAYPMVLTGDNLLEIFFKISDDTDVSGLYSILSPTLAQGNGMSIAWHYDCGGTFEPIALHYPEFAGFNGVYALSSNAFIQSEGNAPSAVVFTEPSMIPAGYMGNEADIPIAPGTYMLCYSEIFACLELVKLQPKDAIIDIDALFGSTLEHGSFTETLNMQIFTEGQSSIQLSNDDFDENAITTQEIFNTLNSAFEQNGSVKIKLHGTLMNSYTNILCPTTLWKSNNQMGAAATLTLYTNSAWITYNLQIYSSKSYFSIYCKGLAAQ